MPPGFRKHDAPYVPPVREPPPQPEIRSLPVRAPDPKTQIVTKPLGHVVTTNTLLLLALLSSVAWAGTVVSAPQGNQGACPFPGCKSATGALSIADPPYSVLPSSAANQTGGIQRAIDACAGTLVFPPGTYRACSLIPRCPNQRWVGAGQGATILQGTTGCANLIVNSNSGAASQWGIEGMTLAGATTALINLSGRDVFRVDITGMSFDVCPQTPPGGTIAINLGGVPYADVGDNEFYSSCPLNGQALQVNRGAHHVDIHDNVMKWLYNGILLGTSSTVTGEVLEGIDIHDNVIDAGGFWAAPVKFSGTTTAGDAGSITDAGANFQGALQRCRRRPRHLQHHPENRQPRPPDDSPRVRHRRRHVRQGRIDHHRRHRQLPRRGRAGRRPRPHHPEGVHGQRVPARRRPLHRTRQHVLRRRRRRHLRRPLHLHRQRRLRVRHLQLPLRRRRAGTDRYHPRCRPDRMDRRHDPPAHRPAALRHRPHHLRLVPLPGGLLHRDQDQLLQRHPVQVERLDRHGHGSRRRRRLRGDDSPRQLPDSRG